MSDSLCKYYEMTKNGLNPSMEAEQFDECNSKGFQRLERRFFAIL